MIGGTLRKNVKMRADFSKCNTHKSSEKATTVQSTIIDLVFSRYKLFEYFKKCRFHTHKSMSCFRIYVSSRWYVSSIYVFHIYVSSRAVSYLPYLRKVTLRMFRIRISDSVCTISSVSLRESDEGASWASGTLIQRIRFCTVAEDSDDGLSFFCASWSEPTDGSHPFLSSLRWLW